MSAARRLRGKMLTAHKAAGTYAPVRLVAHAVADVIMAHARIPRDRKSLYFESSASAEARTRKRDPSAAAHQIAPPDLQHHSRPVSG
ncbi:MAG TPA: hypothetical protein VIK01_26650 [Polyangiaceae bacterium]